MTRSAPTDSHEPTDLLPRLELRSDGGMLAVEYGTQSILLVRDEVMNMIERLPAMAAQMRDIQ